MYYVYILWSYEQSKFYIGYTNDIKRRLSEHRAGKVHSTKRYTQFTLLFYEAFIAQEDAIRRELYFKTTKGKKALRLMLRHSLSRHKEEER